MIKGTAVDWQDQPDGPRQEDYYRERLPYFIKEWGPMDSQSYDFEADLFRLLNAAAQAGAAPWMRIFQASLTVANAHTLTAVHLGPIPKEPK